MDKMNGIGELDLQLLENIYQHFDGIADGAPDAFYASRMALQFSEPLALLIERIKEDPVQRALTQAHETDSDRIWDETITRLRAEGLMR